MLGIRYNPGIDMWSLGCILFELFSGLPLFTGEDEIEQLLCIMEVKGIPPRSMIMQSSRRKMFFNDEYLPVRKENSRGKARVPGSKNLKSMIFEAQIKQAAGTVESTMTIDFVDFLEKCLEMKPDKRIITEEAF
jgi:serine/threonine protein kinase